MSASIPVTKKRVLRLLDGQPDDLDVMVAHVVLFFAVFKVPGLSLFPIGGLLAGGLLITGFFAPTMHRVRPTRILGAATLAAFVTGLMLRFLSMPDDASHSSIVGLATILGWLLAIPAIVVAAMWCFERVDIFRGFITLMLGATVSTVLAMGGVEWKGSGGIFLTILLLALARKRMFITRLILLGSGYLSAINDARSMLLMAVIAFAATLVTKDRAAKISAHPKRWIIGMALALVGMAYAMVQAMLSGLFGQSVQMRTIAQTTNGRDLFTSGRAELAATFELFKQAPFGFGAGVTPGNGLQGDAMVAIRAAGGDYTARQYWFESVFAERLDLHSTFANLWAHFGIGGVFLAVVIGVILARAYPLCIGSMKDFGVFPLFAVLAASWDLLFSPMANSDRIIVGLIAATVLIALRERDLLQPEYREKKIKREPRPVNQQLHRQLQRNEALQRGTRWE